MAEGNASYFREVNLWNGHFKSEDTIGEKNSFKLLRDSLELALNRLKYLNNIVHYVNFQVQSGVDSLCPPQPVDVQSIIAIEDNNNDNNNNDNSNDNNNNDNSNNNGLIPTSSDETSTWKEVGSPRQCHPSECKPTQSRGPSASHTSSGIKSVYGFIHACLMVVFTCWSRGRGAMLTILKHVLYQTSSACCSVSKLSPWVVACWLLFSLPQMAAARFAQDPLETLTCGAEEHAINTTIMHRSEAYARDLDWFEWVRIIVTDFQLIYFGGVVMAVTCYCFYAFIGWPRRTLDQSQSQGNDRGDYDCDYHSSWLSNCPIAIQVEGTPTPTNTNMAVKQESHTQPVPHFLIVGCHGSKKVTQSHLSVSTITSITAPVQDSKSLVTYVTQTSHVLSVIEALPSSPDGDTEDTAIPVSPEMKPDGFQNSFKPSKPVQGGQMKSVIPIANVQAAYKNSRKALNCLPSSTFLLCKEDGLALPLNLHHMKKDANKSSEDCVIQDNTSKGASAGSYSDEVASNISDVAAEGGSSLTSQCCEEDFDSCDLWQFRRYGQITHATYSTSNTVFVHLSVRISQVEVQAISVSVSTSSPPEYDQLTYTDPANEGISPLPKTSPLEEKAPVMKDPPGFYSNECSPGIPPLQLLPQSQCPPASPSPPCTLFEGAECIKSKANEAGVQVEDYSPCCFDATMQFFVAPYNEQEDLPAHSPS